MLTPEQVDGLQDAFQRLTEPLTEYLVKDIARRVSQAGQLTSTAAYQIWKLQKLGQSRDEVEGQVGELLGKELEEVQTLFRQAAEVGYHFDISHLSRDALAFADNAIAQQIVEAAVKLAQEDLTNLTQTMGFVGEDGVVRELTSAYQHATDTAFTQVVSGGADYNTALRKACAQLVRQGIRTIDYESGIHTSLEAAVRRNLMGGLGLMVEEISQKNHDTLGADGWEISAHAMSAPDHEPFQGKQYSDEAYARLNASLHRRIGTLNCGHNAFPILLGISQPQYTPQELEQFRSDNETGVTVDGRHYTGYEATQKQRQIERAIRTQKRRVLVEEAGGDKDRLSAARIRLQRLQQEYRRFSKSAGLRTEEERLLVARVEQRKNPKVKKTGAKQNGNTDTEAVRLVRAEIKNGIYPLTINPEKQARHMSGTSIEGRSVITISLEKLQKMIHEKAGTGTLSLNRKGEWDKKEIIDVGEPIGYTINKENDKIETSKIKIHYSKTGVHIVPYSGR